jgi:ketosteroid isomerase-like protein
MAESALELTRAAIAAWNHGDIEGSTASFDEHIVVRPDPSFQLMEGVCVGREAARRFWRSIGENLGSGRLAELDFVDGGHWCRQRIRQEVHSPTGFDSAMEWSMISSARSGRLVLIEFFLDHDEALAALAG